MTREEIAKWLENLKGDIGKSENQPLWHYAEALDMAIEALDMAIEALKGEQLDEWCTDCKEYDTEKKCCPRFNRVIRGAVADALDAIPSTDRPMVIKCKPFLSEEDFKAFAEQVSDQNVILIPYEAEVVSTNTSTKSTNISTKSTNISTNPSADRPRGEWMEPTSEAIEKRIYGSCEVVCSVCEAAAVDFYDFCPNCGADMRGGTE